MELVILAIGSAGSALVMVLSTLAIVFIAILTRDPEKRMMANLMSMFGIVMIFAAAAALLVAVNPILPFWRLV